MIYPSLENQVIIDAYYSYIKLSDQVYRIIADRTYCNTEVVIGTEKAAIIDGGMGWGDLPGAVRAITDKPLLVFNTHSHIDHVGSNGQFTEPIYMGAEDIAAMRSGSMTDFRKRVIAGRIASNGPESVAHMDLEEYYNRGNGNLVPCQEGDVFDLGGLTLKVINTPGHSAGGRSYFIEELGLLYTGDAVFACTLCFGRGSSPRQQHIDSLKKMLSLDFTQAYSGHYIEPFDKAFIEKALDTAERAVYANGIPMRAPFGGDPRVCFVPEYTPTEEVIEKIKGGDHGLDNKVWAIVLDESK